MGTKAAAPFVLKKDGKWSGLAIELWLKVAAEMKVSAGAYEERTIPELLGGVADGEVDIAIAALTVTAEREKSVDFTHPILSSGLGMAVRSSADTGIWAQVSRFFSVAFLEVLAALALVLLICGTLVYIFERRHNREEFGAAGLAGIGQGFWFAAVTMTTVGYGDKSPKTFGGRCIALVWMFASLLLIANYTAAIASALTLERLGDSVRARDLPEIIVGTASDSAASTWLSTQGYRQRPYTSVRAALDALAAHEVDAVVYDKPILRYTVREAALNTLTVLPDILRRERYAFAVRNNSPLREEINRHILEITSHADWLETTKRYLGR